MIAGDRSCPVEEDITTLEIVLRNRIHAILDDVPVALPGAVPWSWRH